MSKKNEVFSSKREAHKALWSNDTPFKPKIVESKKRYRRKDKHVKKDLGPFSLSL